VIWILVGSLGFIAFNLYDRAILKGYPRATKTILGIATNGSIFLSLMAICVLGFRYQSVSTIIIGVILLILSSFMIYISLGREISKVKKNGEELPFGIPESIIRTGTYTLCRHPGVLWTLLLLVSLFLITGSRLVLISIPIWISLDILHVYIHEKTIWSVKFGEEWDKYKESTPFLIPRTENIRKCIATWK
jgi:protein-S-isoprenylcysteine O-methyltransferase Ste14